MNLEKTQERFIKDVYQNVALYSEKLKEKGLVLTDVGAQWNELPLVTKEDYLSGSYSTIMPDKIPMMLSGELMEVFTSGTSGICLNVLWSMGDCQRSLLPLWLYRKKEYGISPSDKHCYFYSARKIGQEEREFETAKNQLGFNRKNLTDDRLIEIYKRMCEYEPAWLMLQPVMAVLLVNLKKKYTLPEMKSLKYIEMSGEMLSEQLRKGLEDTFHCKVADQYGAYEVNSIAYACHEGNLHCMEENVIVEILDEEGSSVEDGKEGDIYVTSLQNRTMPFIRYKIGDKGYISQTKCNCGRKGRVLCLTQTRTAEWIVTESGEKIDPYVLLRPIINVNKVWDHPIQQFQIIQKGISWFVYKLVAEEEMQREICLGIPENICERRLAGSRIEIVFCDHILPDSDTGKLKWFKTELEIPVRNGGEV